MKLLLLLLAATPLFASLPTFRVDGAGDPAWNRIFQSVDIAAGSQANIVVLPPETTADANALSADHIVIVEGSGKAATGIGVKFSTSTVAVRQIVDARAPGMQIVWANAVTVPIASVPADFQIFASEKWKSAPVLAGKRTSHGALLWMATPPGETGIERYPYLLQALTDLGLETPAKSTSLWAFFDSSYRIRADVDYLAKRWRSSGIGVLHVAVWHNMEPDAARDEYLSKLIQACHRNGILVYAWLELPHVSEQFWADHPEWREKTGVGQDAQLDWRKLMNLQNAQCHAAVADLVAKLMQRFDWDGVNMAELYFESLEGASNPARFTPMNQDVRNEFKEIGGFDPVLLFDANSPYSAAKNGKALRKFLDFRAVLASRMQTDWLKEIKADRAAKPYLDVVLTHIDDRFDPGIRDELGADVARALPLIKAQNATLLVEDPANLWNLGSERYAQLGSKYQQLAPGSNQLAVDINVVERYQDVYPTKKQTGTELFELLHEAARSFPHVAVYFENSIEKQDQHLLSAAATGAQLMQEANGAVEVTSKTATRIAWSGPALIDGKPWPVQGSDYVLAPAGRHVISSGNAPAVTLADFNGDIASTFVTTSGVVISYASTGRTIATLESPLSSIDVDGAPFWKAAEHAGETAVLLPGGQHVVAFNR